ncbi:MAG: hypothetical protein ACI915_001640 [Gammaproteobacteria bacterium]|jgi:hypothetical protein
MIEKPNIRVLDKGMININKRTNRFYRGPALALLALSSAGAMATHNAERDPIPAPIMQGTIRIELESIATGLAGPNHLTHAGDDSDRLFFTEQSDTVRLIENGLLLASPFLMCLRGYRAISGIRLDRRLTLMSVAY